MADENGCAMRDNTIKTAIDHAASRLRTIVLDREEGALIGSEEGLIALLGCSRSTIRQVARLLEREGLLRVRRGINGGYFGARPNAATIEMAVSAYLETLSMDPQDVTIVASALWVEAMRKASQAPPELVLAQIEPFAARVRAIKPNEGFAKIQTVETDFQSLIFALGKSEYIKLIFDINVAFSRRNFAAQADDDDTRHHAEFLAKWRDAKLLELDAVITGDSDLAMLAAQYSRKVWHQRIRSRFFAGDAPPDRS